MISKKSASKCRLSGRSKLLLVVVGLLGLAALWSYFSLDQQVFSWLCKHPISWRKSPWLRGFEYLGKGWVLVWLLLVWLVLTGQRRLVQSAFLALILCALVVNPLKVAVGRARPSEVKVESESKNNRRIGRHVSFPSGDTAVVFAVATTVLAFSRRPFAVLLLGASTGIGLLRIAGMAHYPSDVLAGAGIGCLCGWLAVQIEPRWVRWQIPQSDLSRRLAILGIVVIPIAFGLAEGIRNLPILLGTYGVSGILVLLAAGKMRCCRTN